MLDQGNAQLSPAGFYNPTMGQRPLDEFFGGASAEGGALPHEVRWDAELDGGDGGWKIFLPTSHLLAYDGSYVTPTGVTAMSDGWYSLDDVQRSSTHVWLVLSVVDSTGVCTAEFSPTQGQSVTGTTVYNVCVAEVSYTAPAAAGDQPTVVIKQSLVGALHLGGGGGGAGVTPDDVSTEFIPDPPSGTEPGGDEGKLQIKDWKNTSLVDPNSLADYSQGVAAIPQNGIQVVARFPQTGSPPLLGYVPLAQLTEKYLSAGENVVITKQGNNIIISSPGGGGGGTTPDTSADGVSDTFVVGGQVSYSTSTRKFTQPLWRLTFQNGVLIEKLELTQAEIQAVQETLP